ncbi:nuclease A inhibitor family protein [Chondromyces apiculatus]|uniref:Sugar-non-specific nuclease inhibitor NuiA n=1 Tax=Chondromyces apiculatus DSM 436 TaxID=1192034 RepID=A0A017TDG6_9BACT|nr:nuclease A inhibitor family protein [Chondromyces apiculatus]EYF06626.1 sugar-non-specific nuclease inhibitor NuiA [Chondromyces apiculatus DSM 436]
MTSKELLARLGEVVTGLSFPSERDAPVEVLEFGAGEPSEEAVRAKLQAPADAPVETETVEALLAPLLAAPEDGGVEPDQAARYQEAAALLRDHLEAARVYRVGKVEVDVLVLGKHADGAWLGLRTRVVET